MHTTTIATATIVDDSTTFTISEICSRCNVSHDLLVQMMEHGLFEFNNPLHDDFKIDLKTLQRIESAFHLHRDLEINMPGIALVLELRDELETLRNELNVLYGHLNK